MHQKSHFFHKSRFRRFGNVKCFRIKGRTFPNRLSRDLRKQKENEMKRNENESKFKAMYLNLQFHRKSRGRRFGNIRPFLNLEVSDSETFGKFFGNIVFRKSRGRRFGNIRPFLNLEASDSETFGKFFGNKQCFRMFPKMFPNVRKRFLTN